MPEVKPSLRPTLYLRARRAVRYGNAQGTIGMEFDRFGRGVGRKLLFRDIRRGLPHLIAPVSSVRYFEFPFASACLRPVVRRCLDVSSPRLFSLYVAAHDPEARITVANPDETDLEDTRAIASMLGLDNIRSHHGGVEGFADATGCYDCIWSLSVIEHIMGETADTDAVKLLYDALAPGGRLIFTVPVDRSFRVEYRDTDPYGLQGGTEEEMAFFSRVYDGPSVEERLIAPITASPAVVRWFGERSAGHYAMYERRWKAGGIAVAVDDAREIADHYREYKNWEEMPGMGVCGVAIDKAGTPET